MFVCVICFVYFKRIHPSLFQWYLGKRTPFLACNPKIQVGSQTCHLFQLRILKFIKNNNFFCLKIPKIWEFWSKNQRAIGRKLKFFLMMMEFGGLCEWKWCSKVSNTSNLQLKWIFFLILLSFCAISFVEQFWLYLNL